MSLKCWYDCVELCSLPLGMHIRGIRALSPGPGEDGNEEIVCRLKDLFTNQALLVCCTVSTVDRELNS